MKEKLKYVNKVSSFNFVGDLDARLSFKDREDNKVYGI